MQNQVQNFLRCLALGFSILTCPHGIGVTQGVHYPADGIVKLKNNISGSTCTGAIIGDNPIKVASVLHCIDDYVTGQINLQLPIDPALPRLRINGNSLPAPTLTSKKVYITQNPEVLALIEKKKEKEAKIQELDAEIKALEGGYFTLKTTALDPTDINFMDTQGQLELEEARNRLMDGNFMKRGKLIRERYLTASVLESLVSRITTEFYDEEFIILIFEGSLEGNESLIEKAKKLKVIPLARENNNSEHAEVILGGFGMTYLNDPYSIPEKLLLTTNTLQKHDRKAELKQAFGYWPQDAEAFGLNIGEMGAPLKGDSGGPALTAQGIVGVLSMIHNFEGSIPPLPNWRSVYSQSSAFELYRYTQAVYPSTLSRNAKEILARVESEVSPVLYADQVPDFEEIFTHHFEKLKETGFVESLNPSSLSMQ